MLYFTEDSHADVGLVQCLFDEWPGCLNVLRDYLHWACDADPMPPPDAPDWKRRVDDHLAFLKYGLEEVPDALDLDATLHFLDNALPDAPDDLHERRHDFYTPSPVQRPADLTIGPACDFCGTPLSEVEHERLGDGRVRCDACGETATDTADELREVYQEARAFLESEIGLDLRQSVRIELTDAQTVHEAAGKSFVPTPGYDARTIGVATRRGKDFAIYVENGQPYHRTLSTTVHELTHIWQFDHLDYPRMAEEHGKLLIEGHAVWADLEVLKRRDLRPDYVERETQRDDVYGEGYRRLCEMLDDAPDYDTPFALLADLYPPK